MGRRSDSSNTSSDECKAVSVDVVQFQYPRHDAKEIRIVIVRPSVQLGIVTNLRERPVANPVRPELNAVLLQLTRSNAGPSPKLLYEARIYNHKASVALNKSGEFGDVRISPPLSSRDSSLILSSPELRLNSCSSA